MTESTPEQKPATELERMWARMARRRAWCIARMTAVALILVALFVWPAVLTQGWLGLPPWVWTGFGAVLAALLFAHGLRLADLTRLHIESRAVWQHSQAIVAIEREHLEQWVAFHKERRVAERSEGEL